METFLYPKKLKNADFTVWMGFPERYEFSLSSLGYLWLFKIIDEMEDINAERICTDTEKTIAQTPDMFSFSFSFDFDFLKIFEMLDKYNIPLKSAEREKPLIFAGGPVVTANPEPYKDIFDFFIIGDGEDVNKKVIEFCKNNRELPKNELLKEISEFEGVYVPYVSQKVVKSTKRLEQCIYTPIISDEAFFKNTFIIEMERGCANRCGFCLASYLNLPLRSVPKDELFNAIDFGLKYTNKIAFLGAEVSAHPQFEAVCDYIYKRVQAGENIEMNFSSLRVDAIKENVIKTLVACGQKNITLAIEAGSERLRKVINKNITEEQIFNAVEIAHKNGLKGIKFYGMIGLPTETQENIEEFVNLIKKIKNNHKGFEISCGFSSFVPKPHTPFQWIGREDTKSLEKKCQFLQKELRKIGVNVQLPSVKWDYWQAVLSRGCKAAKQLGSYTITEGKRVGRLEDKLFNISDNSEISQKLQSDNSLPSYPTTFQSTPSPQPFSITRTEFSLRKASRKTILNRFARQSPSKGGGSMQLLPYNFTDFLIDIYKQGGKLGAFKSSAKKYGIDTDYLAYGDFRCSPYYLTRHCTAHTSPTMTPSPTKKSCRRGENSYRGEGVCNDFGAELPWDFIEISPGKEFLAKECKKLIGE